PTWSVRVTPGRSCLQPTAGSAPSPAVARYLERRGSIGVRTSQRQTASARAEHHVRRLAAARELRKLADFGTTNFCKRGKDNERFEADGAEGCGRSRGSASRGHRDRRQNGSEGPGARQVPVPPELDALRRARAVLRRARQGLLQGGGPRRRVSRGRR